MIIIYDEQSNTYSSVTPSSEDATLPGTNALNDHLGRLWRTDATARDENIVWNHGTSFSAPTGAVWYDIKKQDALSGIFNSLTSAPSTFKFQSNSSNSWGAPTVDESLTFGKDDDQGICWGYWAGSNSNPLQYKRMVFTKSADDHTVGRVFYGASYTSTAKPEYAGFDEAWEDLTETARADDGSTYSNVKSKYRRLTVNFREVSQSDKDSMNTVFAKQGTGAPFFIQPDETHLTDLYYVKFAKPPRFSVSGYDGGLLWDVDLDFVEEV